MRCAVLTEGNNGDKAGKQGRNWCPWDKYGARTSMSECTKG